MCGIFGTHSNPAAIKDVIQGLNDLSYRGYDSWGIAFYGDKHLEQIKSAGNVPATTPIATEHRRTAIGHTRWSTHGGPSDTNAHPHLSQDQRFAVVHNGIIENHRTLREQCPGIPFTSETDTEVIVHLISKEVANGKSPIEALRCVGKQLEGRYAFVVLDQETDGFMALCSGSPLVVGLSECGGVQYIASDVQAISRHATQVMHLKDDQLLHCHKQGIDLQSISTGDIQAVDMQPISRRIKPASKGQYTHFMRKEIDEQATCFENSAITQLPLELSGIDRKQLQGLTRIILLGCGTSWHAALLAEYWLEQELGLPVEVEYASEFRYRHAPLFASDCVIALSQSGETADTNAAVELAKSKGATIIGICNVPDSTLTRLADTTFYTEAGPEIGVASTKAFTTQLAILYQLTLALSVSRETLTLDEALSRQAVLHELPEKIRTILAGEPRIRELASKIYTRSNALFMGRGLYFPIALEGALKLKEVSYIHAEGYPAAEMKHGPIALIDEQMPVFIIATQDESYLKIRSNIAEVKSRGAYVIAIANENDSALAEEVDEIIELPITAPDLMPILSVIPFQLLAYHVASFRGCNIDKPRNLAKSVTVE